MSTKRKSKILVIVRDEILRISQIDPRYKVGPGWELGEVCFILPLEDKMDP